MNIYEVLEQAIISNDILVKEALTTQCLVYCNQNEVSIEEDFVPKMFTQPSYTDKCIIVAPKDLRTRKDFDTLEGLATLVHSIAHIEYSAIDLALDAVYRYPEMSIAYKIDWLEVASDEIRHFQMLDALLIELGFSYGDFPVHCGLFDAANNTAHNILDRMAIVPRYFEASGLDVSPQIIKKLDNKRKNAQVKKLIDTLHIIYDEEIDHVLKGDKWFKNLCKKEGHKEGTEEEVYFEILERYHLLSKHRPHVNVEARKEAGFSCSEIKKLGAKECT
ncbi:ferritin-like domain-containing protein [Sulfurovum sp.]|uniref:ferritin-like domain-containing protein n=1 Tax=Sulfurovum sp. TaxID=1969726 RepID=UPI0035620060